MSTTNFNTLQREFLGALSSGYEGIKTLACQKVVDIDVLDIEPLANATGKCNMNGKFSNLLIIHQVKTNEIITVTMV